MGQDLDELRAALAGVRASVLRKVAMISDADARRSPVPSGTSLAGLLQHLTYVESRWFEEVVAGGTATRGLRSMLVDPSVSLRALRSEYRAACAACAASDAVLDGVGRDSLVTRHGKTRTVESVMIHVIEETARHAGHADIIREQIDGRTGR